VASGFLPPRQHLIPVEDKPLLISIIHVRCYGSASIGWCRCQVKSPSLQSIGLSTSTNLIWGALRLKKASKEEIPSSRGLGLHCCGSNAYTSSIRIFIRIFIRIPNATLLMVSHLRAPPSGRVCWEGKPTTQLAVQRPSAPTINVVILQILIDIISLKPGRFSVQKARMNNQLREFLTATHTLHVFSMPAHSLPTYVCACLSLLEILIFGWLPHRCTFPMLRPFT